MKRYLFEATIRKYIHVDAASFEDAEVIASDTDFSRWEYLTTKTDGYLVRQQQVLDEKG